MQTDKISASNKKKQIFVPPKQIIGIVVLKYRFYCYICAMFRKVHILFCGLLLCTSVSLSAQSRERITREEYIEEYAPLAIEAQEEGGLKLPTKGPQNLLDQLPEIFTREEAGLMRQRQNIRTGSLAKMIFNWKDRGYIELMEGEDTTSVSRKFRKTKLYLDKHPQSSILS